MSSSPSFLSTILSSIPFLFLLLLFVKIDIAEAFPFSKSSGVVELTPSTFNQFVSSHKPVYILFYAPWCGHCRTAHPEWEKFAQAVRGTIRVGAINADEHKQLSGQFGIRGFPTIKYWPAGEKNFYKAEDYVGMRQAGAIQASAMSLIPSSSVNTVVNGDALRDAVRKAPQKKVAVLFSSKTHVPPMFSILSLSPRLKSMPFYFVGGKAEKGVAEEFGVKQLPGIAVLSAAEGDIKTLLYEQRDFTYEPIAKFLLSCVTNTLDESTASSKTDGDAKEEKGKKASGRVTKLEKPARPVQPTAELLATFCSSTAQQIGGQYPLCVVSLTSALSLDAVQREFRNRPLVFFEAHTDRDVLADFLQEESSLAEIADTVRTADTSRVLLLQASEKETVHHTFLDGIEVDYLLIAVLQKFLNGELKLSKIAAK